MRCNYCRATNATVKSCFWPVLAMRNTPVGELRVGDQIQTAYWQFDSSHRRVRRDGGLIVSIVPHHQVAGMLQLTIQANKIEARFGEHTWQYGWHPSASIFAIRPAACGVAACELHHQERGPNHFVCFDHWHAWSKAKEAA